MDKKNRIWRLIAKKLTGEASPQECMVLSQLLQEYPDFSFQVEILSALWKQPEQKDCAETDNAFARHLQRLAQQKNDNP